MLKPFLLFFIVIFSISCNDNSRGDAKAVDIIDQSIEKHGGKDYLDMDVSFTYRQFRVHLKQDEGIFLYERTCKDSSGNELHDILTNDFFKREMNSREVKLSPEETNRYKEGLNAISYFALLPYKLSEPAVKLAYLGETTIGETLYDKIGVSFNAEGGGKDHLDEFCYWINHTTHTMDYFAYSNGGPRFRKATVRKKVDGIIFQDYDNYQILDSSLATFDYDKAFIAGKDSLLSTIKQDNYKAGAK